ncbi:hypothetical protein CCACVL1_02660 [Corchorus capsularis]|uniref:Peptidase C78, ubiquitin fold modifier-specific peptidase 1/ 2 n=1 Tax=Corchorus capsularis TaxID=210143 RepID=A0A1R3K763_COCAP|nr:hypothetical protein CCACVL1_02660 [Corchorus capsularis]
MEKKNNRSIRVECSKLMITRNESDLLWLIGSSFFSPLTIFSTFRCIHSNPSGPDFHKESEEIRTLLLKGFDVIGALIVGKSDSEKTAAKAIEAARKLRKDLCGTRNSVNEVIIGGFADQDTGDIRFFVSESENSTRLESVNSVSYDDNPEKLVWESGCLLRCELPIKLPFCFPINKPSDAENIFSHAIEAVIARFKDPNVMYMVEASSKSSSNTVQPVIIHGTQLDFDTALPDIELFDEASHSSDQKLLQCAHFCLKNKSSPELLSAENADIIQVSVLLNRSESSPKCNAPTAEYFPALEETRLLIVDFKLEVLCYAVHGIPLIHAISKLIIPGLVDQLISMKNMTLPSLLTEHPQLHPYHFTPPGIVHPITVIYELNYGETELKQVDIRRSLHLRLGLPFDRPLLRIASALQMSTKDRSSSSSTRKGSPLLKNVHSGIPSSGGGIISLVQGSYEYYHYLQDGFDDSGWGCAYRSLQTIISWFRLQHYSSIDVPSHREIQQCLVDIGDKDPSFIGSREWIGAIELSFVLDKLLGVSCKVINVRSGSELPEKCRELALHFESQGTPIMIGGGVLAYTLVGVDYNEATGDCAFLILDPHYTGSDDVKKIAETMSLTQKSLGSSSFPFKFHNHLPNNLSSKPPLFLSTSKSFPSSSIFATPPPASHSSSSSSSSSSIFLPFLEEPQLQELAETENPEPQQAGIQEEAEEEEENDPIIRFFKSRPSAPDPPRQGKFALQKNRRSSWHLAPDIRSLPDPESELDGEYIFSEAKQQTDSTTEDSTKLPQDIVGEIVRIANNLPQNSTLGELLGGYQGKVSEKDCLQVLALLGKEGLVMGCLYFYEWMRLQEPSLVTPRACSVLFPVLGRAKMGDWLMILFRNLPQSKAFRDVHVYNSAMSGLLCSKSYDDAWKVYEAMEANNVQPDHVTCSIMITVMRKAGRSAKDAWEFFDRMNRKGVKWSPEVLGAIIKSFCDEGLKKEALIIQSEMEKKGVPSNTIVYNTLMDAYSKSHQIEEVEGLFTEMKAKGLVPTSATFNILMDAYSRRMQPEIVEKLLLEMQDVGLKPNAKSYTCLISAYGRQKKMSDRAADAFLRMKKAGLKPSSHSYTSLIHAYSIGGWHEKAYTAFENMQREGIKPSIETFTALLDAFRRAGDTQTLMKIWKLMISEKVEGTRVTFNILLDGFAKQGHYIEARDVISEFGKIGLQPTLMTYNMLMNAYARGGQHQKLPQLLKEMATLNLKPDSVTYLTMIYSFVRVRDFKRAFYYHKQMVKSGQVPDVKSYEKLRSILDVKAAKKNKRDKSAILGIIKSKMGMVKAKRKTKKDEFWKNKKKHPKFSDIAPSRQQL